VRGCFWHVHSGCALARLPKSRGDFWLTKLNGNATRDQRNLNLLRRRRWSVLVVWECELSELDRLSRRLRKFLSNGKTQARRASS
jgi:DNA mismatch endonuclease (patch repair protein)